MQAVSIIIPAYNAERFLKETIESVLSQTFTAWELIIVNDGSSDDTIEIARSFEDQRIRIIDQTNSGVSAARNIGIANASGDYLAFLDADDIWEPGNLQAKVSLIETNAETDWVYSDMGAIDENGNALPEPAIGRDDDILRNILLWETEVVPGPCSNLLIKGKCFEEGVKFDERLSTAADQDICLQLAAGYKGKRIPEKLWHYRILDTSMSRNIKTMEKDHLAVYRKAESKGWLNGFRDRAFSNLYLTLAGSWWKEGNNKWKGLKYLIRAILTHPQALSKIFSKAR